MKSIHPMRDLVLCRKTEPPQTRDNKVKVFRPGLLLTPGTFWAEVVAVGPRAVEVHDGDVVELPTTMEPVRAEYVLVPEREILCIVE